MEINFEYNNETALNDAIQNFEGQTLLLESKDGLVIKLTVPIREESQNVKNYTKKVSKMLLASLVKMNKYKKMHNKYIETINKIETPNIDLITDYE